MAQSYTLSSGITEYIPGTTVDTQVQANQGGSAASGVVTLIGEADEGPDFTLESDLDTNSFGPDQITDIIAKYGSGRLVDACREIFAASADPGISGQVSLVKPVKTNPSLTASALLSQVGIGGFSTLAARRAGAPGNLIQYANQIAQAEQAPQTVPFDYTPYYTGSAVEFKIRVNGNSPAETVAVSAIMSPAAFAAEIESVSEGILVQGGQQSLPLTGDGAATITAALVPGHSSQLAISLQTASLFNPAPAPGDVILIPNTSEFGITGVSCIVGAGQANAGSYIVLSVANTASLAQIIIQQINSETGLPLVAATGTSTAAISGVPADILSVKPMQILNATGMDRQATVGLSGTFNVTSNNGTTVVLVAPSNFRAQPVPGDLLTVGAIFAGVQIGFYQVVSSTANSVTFSRLSNGTSGSGSGLVTIGTAIVKATQPFLDLKPIINGLGKSLEFSGDMSSIATDPSLLTPSTFQNSLLVSAAEQEVSFTISKGNSQTVFSAGGDLLISVGCSQSGATMVISPTQIQFLVGVSVIFTATFAQFNTLGSLVSFINAHATFSATLLQAKFGAQPLSILDDGTFGISSDIGAQPARLKNDANEFFNAISGSGLAFPVMSAGASGLPEAVSPSQFLSGGTKGGTSSAIFVNAIDACQQVDTNFMVALISADSSIDVADGDTDPSSSYSVDSVNSYLKSHVLEMSLLTSKKNRIAICARNGSYAAQKNAAGVLSSDRVALAFQDQNVLGGSGSIQEFQSWMGAVIAAGMQAAAGYKGIVHKQANTNGVIKPEKDFNAGNPSQLTDALKSGLLIMEKRKGGGFRWVSDQTTYSVDNNFVYNSLQAVYVSDLMALTMIQNFDNNIVGQSVADITAKGVLSFLDSQMFDFLRLKWISPSDDAPKGYKNASVRIQGGVILVSFEAKLAGLIYFVPITMQLSQVQQSASQ